MPELSKSGGNTINYNFSYSDYLKRLRLCVIKNDPALNNVHNIDNFPNFNEYNKFLNNCCPCPTPEPESN
jgi:hypothetical protein